MNTKSLYPLIGDNTEKINWVVTSSLRPDLSFPVQGQNSFLSATNYPLLKEEHIPFKWLKEYQGFPILLIEPSKLDQDWVYHPYDQTKNYYQLRQSPPAEVRQTLVVLEENATFDEIRILNDTLSGPKFFIYRDRENFEMINQQSFPIFNSYLFCFQSSWRPDLIVFQKPSLAKCLRPHIVHAIHLGGFIQTEYWNKAPSIKKELWYGTWELFHV
jgi:hypothetical protein